MVDCRTPVPVKISTRDANTIRLALVNYNSRMFGGNSLAKEALEVASRLLADADKSRDEAEGRA